jgi:hypothetical protein
MTKLFVIKTNERFVKYFGIGAEDTVNVAPSIID